MMFSDEKFFRWNYTGTSQNSPSWVVGVHGRPTRKADLDPDVCINEIGCAHQHRCCIRMLDDVCLPHRMAEGEIQLLTRQTCSPEPTTSQLELRAMIVLTVSALDPEAAEKACTTGFIHRCLACVRQRRPSRAPPVMDQLTCTGFLLVSFDPSSRWASFFCGFWNLQAPSAQATDCDLESGSRKSTSVWGPCLCFASPSLLFFSFPLFSLSPFPLSLPLTLPPSPLSSSCSSSSPTSSHFFTCQHHHFFISIFLFSNIYENFLIFTPIRPEFVTFLHFSISNVT